MKRDVDDIVCEIANRERVSKQEVLDEMQRAIDAGYNNPDPAVQAYWASLPFGGKPTPQEFIAYFAGQARKKARH